MFKLILVVALFALPVNNTGKIPTIDERLQVLSKALRAELAKCEAPVEVEFCAIQVQITRYYDKDKVMDKRYMALESKGAPSVSFHSSDRNPTSVGNYHD